MDKNNIIIKLEAQDKINLETAIKEGKPLIGDWKFLCSLGQQDKHGLFGNIDHDEKRLHDLVDNFKGNTIGREIPFNYNHNGKSLAALWVNDMKKIFDENGKIKEVHFQPRYTKSGYKLIDEENLKYGSMEFKRDFNNKGAVLWGGACTNDPHSTGKHLIKLENKEKEEDESMTKEEMIALFNSFKSEILNEKTVKLEAEKSKQDAELELKYQKQIVKLEAERTEERKSLLKDRITLKKQEWMNNSIPGGAIKAVEDNIFPSDENVKLEAADIKEQLVKLDFADKIFAGLKGIVPTKQQGKGKDDTVKLERDKSKKTEQEEWEEEMVKSAERSNKILNRTLGKGGK